MTQQKRDCINVNVCCDFSTIIYSNSASLSTVTKRQQQKLTTWINRKSKKQYDSSLDHQLAVIFSLFLFVPYSVKRLSSH